eukprot:gene12970-17391_t
MPSYKPSNQPLGFPSLIPTSSPSYQPSIEPSGIPSLLPSVQPMTLPTRSPSNKPSTEPSSLPSVPPTCVPSDQPSNQPFTHPTSQPVCEPSSLPTYQPVSKPSYLPSFQPLGNPTSAPTPKPTPSPTPIPSKEPTPKPSRKPSRAPTADPSFPPTISPTDPKMLISFNSTIIIETSSFSKLSLIVISTYAEVLNLPLTCFKLMSAQAQAKSQALRHQLASNFVKIIVQVTVSMNYFPFATDPSIAFEEMKSSLMNSVSDGSFTNTLQNVSNSFSTNLVLSTSSSSVQFTTYVVRYPGSNPPTLFPTLTPSSKPTVAPSFSEVEKWTNRVQLGLIQLRQNASSNFFSSMYTEMNIGSISYLGGCTTWKSFVFNELIVAMFQYAPSSVRAFRVTADQYSFKTDLVSCDEYLLVKNMISFLISSNFSNSISMECSNHKWLGRFCHGQQVPSLCVDCIDPCSVKALCLQNTSHFVEPCRTSSCEALGITTASAIQLFSFDFKSPETAPDIIGIEVFSTSSALTIQATLSFNGKLYCGAYTGGNSEVSSLDQIVLENNYAQSVSNVSYVEISSLSSLTVYTLYCLTESSYGYRTSLEIVQESRIIISTLCCKTVNLYLSESSALEDTAMINILSLSLSSRPTEELIVRFILTDSNNNSIVDVGFFPTQATFTNEIVSPMQIYGSLIPLPISNYTISVELSANAEPSLPTLLESRFSNDGTFIAILFDSDTNKGGTASSFICSSLFDFSCASTSTCRWANNKIVNAYVYSSDRDKKCAAPGQSLSLSSSSQIRAKCKSKSNICLSQSNWQYMKSITVPIFFPVKADKPQVCILAPNVIGSCDSLTLDATSSIGSGGRSWTNISVTVSSGSTDNFNNITDLEMFLSKSYKFSPPSSIEASLIPKGFSYRFVVTLCNFLGACASASKVVLAMNVMIPSVTIPGESLLKINSYSSLSISSNAFIAACDSSVVTTGLSYTWSISSNNVPILSLYSSSKDPSKFKLSAYTLPTNKLYTVSITVVIAATSMSASTFVKVFVLSGNLIPVIEGNGEFTVRLNSSIELDGSTSYDEDIDQVYGKDAGLSYSWNCYQISPFFSTVCSENFILLGSGSSAFFPIKVPLDASIKMIGVVTMTITDKALERSAQASVKISVAPSTTPVIGLASNAESNVINSDVRLQITASVSIAAGTIGRYLWSVNDSAFSLSSNSLTKIGANLSAPTDNNGYSQFQLFLVLASNSLSTGSTLSFSLSIYTQFNTIPTSTSITIVVNAPPTPGFFEVTPLSGVALIDKFTFFASLWHDDNVPLNYQFGYFTQSEVFVTAQSKSSTTYGRWSMPSGASSSNFTIICVCKVYDVFEAHTVNNFSIQVVESKVSFSNSQLNDYISSAFEDSSNNADGLKRASSISSYLLNKADCSMDFNCSAIHRMDCSTTSFTCGSCLNGYIGEADDSNEPCFDQTFDSRKLSSISCKSSMECDMFYECKNSSCIIKNKSCGSGCGSFGHCSFRNKDTKYVIPQCSVFDMKCEGICVCDYGYFGSTCNITEKELLSKQLSRNKVMNGLIHLTNLEDPQESSILDWTSILVENTKVFYELSEEAIINSFDLLQSIIAYSGDEGVSYEKNIQLFKVLDSSTLAATSTNSNITTVANQTVANLILTTLKNYNAQLIFSQIVPGQQPFSSIQHDFRSISQSTSTSFSSNTQLLAPLTMLESKSGVSLSQVDLKADSEKADSVQLSLTTISASLYSNASFHSNPINIQYSSLPCNDKTNCFVNITLPYTTALDLTPYDSHNESIIFACDGSFKIHVYHCSNGYIINSTCSNSVIGNSTHVCPTKTITPSCKAIVNSTAVDIGCSVMRYNANNITCSCPLNYNHTSNSRTARRGNSRILKSSKTRDATTKSGGNLEGGDISYVTMLESTESNVVNTFESAEELNLSVLEKQWTVLVTILLFGVVSAIFMLIGHSLDSQDVKELQTNESLDRKTIAESLKDISYLLTNPTQAKDEYARVERRRKIHRMKTESIKKEKLNFAKYIEKILPKSLRQFTMGEKLTYEMKSKHKYFNIIFAYSPTFPRSLRVLALSSAIIIMLFVQSVTYNLTSGDDGTCKTYTDPIQCESSKSLFKAGASKCTWNPPSEEAVAGDSCTFNQPDSNNAVVLFVAIISAIISTPLSLFVFFIIKRILSAKTRSYKRVEPIKYNFEEDLTDNSVDFRVMNRVQTQVSSKSISGEFVRHNENDGDDNVRSFIHDDDDESPINSPFKRIKPFPISSSSQSLVVPTNSRSWSNDELDRSPQLISKNKQKTMKIIINKPTSVPSINDEAIHSLLSRLSFAVKAHYISIEDVKDRDHFKAMWGLTPNGDFDEFYRPVRSWYEFIAQSITFDILQRDEVKDIRRLVAQDLVKMQLLENEEVIALTDKFTAEHEDLLEDGENDHFMLKDSSDTMSLNNQQQDMMNNNNHKSTKIRQKRKQLQFEIKQKQAIRNRLLFLYQCDLLPSGKGKVLEAQLNRDEYLLEEKDRVSFTSKVIGWSVIIGLDTVMVFYIFLFAILQDKNHQNAWFKSFLMWIVGEVFWSSSQAVIISNVLIPSLISNDMTILRQKLIQSLHEQQQKVLRNLTEENYVTDKFNAAKFLYISYRVAKHFPDFIESKIIHTFSTVLPKISYTTSDDSTITDELTDGYDELKNSLFSIAFILIMALITLPIGLQDAVLDVISTISSGFVILMHLQLFALIPILVTLPAITVIIILHFYFRASKGDRKVEDVRLQGLYDEKRKKEQEQKEKNKHTNKIIKNLKPIPVLLGNKNIINDDDDDDDEEDESDEETINLSRARTSSRSKFKYKSNSNHSSPLARMNSVRGMLNNNNNNNNKNNNKNNIKKKKLTKNEFQIFEVDRKDHDDHA